MRAVAVLAVSAIIALAAPACAQDMPGMDMSGMKMPMPPHPAAKKPPTRKPEPLHRPVATDHPAPPKPMPESVGAMMSGMIMALDSPGSMPGTAMPAAAGTALPPGHAPAPLPPADHYADRIFPGATMTAARSHMMHESGAQTFSQVMFNLAEIQLRAGQTGYRWDGQAWAGGDISRLWLKTEGDGVLRDGVGSAEIQALYSRAVGPYFNLQGGVRQDLGPSPRRTYATVGFEGLSPYLPEVEGALFLSNHGDLSARLEGYYDQRITQRLILQPRVELNLSAQDVPHNRIGAGLTDAELGLRLRYEIAREFAPYVGVSYEAMTGRTADFARADRHRPAVTSFVAGVRFWF